MNQISEKLRKVADTLRKQSAEKVEPGPTPNPTASLARGDLGSLDAGAKTTKPAKSFVPKLPKVGV